MSRDSGLLAPVRSPFRALVEAFVPRTSSLDEAAWERLFRVVEEALTDRPAEIRHQVVLLIRVLDWLPALRYGRRLRTLPADRRRAFLSFLQDAPLVAVRRGVWGLRTLAFMGYYGRPEAYREIGYRAHPDGWEARDDPAPWEREA